MVTWWQLYLNVSPSPSKKITKYVGSTSQEGSFDGAYSTGAFPYHISIINVVLILVDAA